jgi:hypothetical protein
MSLTDIGENYKLDWIVGRAALPGFATAYAPATPAVGQGCLGLFKVTPTDLGEVLDEVSGGNYGSMSGGVSPYFVAGTPPAGRLSVGPAATAGTLGHAFPAAANGMNSNSVEDVIVLASPTAALGAVNAVQVFAYLTIASVTGWYALWNSQIQGVAQCFAGVPILIPKGALSAKMSSGSVLCRPTANKVLDWALKGAAQSAMTVKLGLLSAPPNADGTGFTEVNGGVSGTNGYARPTASTYYTAAAAQGQVANMAEIPFGTPSSNWGDANYVCGFADPTYSAALWCISIPTKTCFNSGPIKIPAGALIFSGD